MPNSQVLISRMIARQLGSPGGMVGWLAGWIWNRRNAALNDTVLALLDLQPADRVLDVGFGGGYLLNRMAAVVRDGLLAGVDISPAMVAYTAKRYSRAVRAGRLDLRCASAEALPFQDAYFSKVCSINSIFYWQNAAQGISEIYRVLSPGGRAALCFTCKESIEQKNFAKNIQLYEPEAIAQQMVNSGFLKVQTPIFSDQYRRYVTLVGEKE